MKKHDVKILALMTVVIVIVWGCVCLFFAESSDKIEYYLDEYDIENVTVTDVALVDLHLRKYIKIGETEKSDIVLSRTFLFERELMLGYSFSDRLGTGYVFKDRHDNVYTVTGTDDWCPYFRVYYVSKGVIGG